MQTSNVRLKLANSLFNLPDHIKINANERTWKEKETTEEEKGTDRKRKEKRPLIILDLVCALGKRESSANVCNADHKSPVVYVCSRIIRRSSMFKAYKTRQSACRRTALYV